MILAVRIILGAFLLLVLGLVGYVQLVQWLNERTAEARAEADYWEREARYARQDLIVAKTELARAQQAGPYGGLAETLGCVRGGETGRLLDQLGYSSASLGRFDLALLSQVLRLVVFGDGEVVGGSGVGADPDEVSGDLHLAEVVEVPRWPCPSPAAGVGFASRNCIMW